MPMTASHISVHGQEFERRAIEDHHRQRVGVEQEAEGGFPLLEVGDIAADADRAGLRLDRFLHIKNQHFAATFG